MIEKIRLFFDWFFDWFILPWLPVKGQKNGSVDTDSEQETEES